MISVLHTTDWQIGRVFSQFEPDDANALFEARFKAVEALAELATTRGVDAVLVAGDVFDAQTVADKTIRRLFNAMQGFVGPWLLLPGNHDAALTESVWTRAQRLRAIASNVTCCLEPRAHAVGGKFTLLAAPLTQRHTHLDLTEWFDSAASDPALPRVGLAHGCVQGILAPDMDSTNPIAAQRWQSARLDYLALGDWHGTRQVGERAWYAGTPETDRFRANDSGRALLVNLPGAGEPPRVEVVVTGRYRWRQMEPHLSVATHIDELLAQLSQVGSEEVLSLRILGNCDLGGHRRLAAALDEAGARARAIVWDNSALRLEPTDEDIDALHADGYVGEVLQELRLPREGEEAQLARDALLSLAQILDAQAQRAADAP